MNGHGGSTTSRWPGRRVLAVAAGWGAGVLYCDFLVVAVTRPEGVDQWRIVSQLESSTEWYGAVMRSWDIVSGLLTVVLAILLATALPRRWVRWIPVLLVAAFGLLGALTAVFPTCVDAACSTTAGQEAKELHGRLSDWSDWALLLSPLAVLVANRGGRRFVTHVTWVALVLLWGIDVVYGYRAEWVLPGRVGVYQRALIVAAGVWLVLLGYIGRERAPDPPRPVAGDRDRSRGTFLVVVAVAAAVLYSNFLIDWALRGFTDFGVVISNLEAPDQPHATFLRVTDVVCALLVLLLVRPARAALAPGWERNTVALGTVLFAVGSIVAAIVPTPCGITEVCTSTAERRQIAIHDLASIVSEVAVFVGMIAAWWLARRTGPRWLVPYAFWLFWLGGVLGDVLFTWYGWDSQANDMTGYVQRFHIASISVWIVCLGVLARDGRAIAHGGADDA